MEVASILTVLVLNIFLPNVELTQDYEGVEIKVELTHDDEEVVLFREVVKVENKKK